VEHAIPPSLRSSPYEVYPSGSRLASRLSSASPRTVLCARWDHPEQASVR